MKRAGLLAALAGALVLSACGFRPLYANGGQGGQPAIGAVVIDEIPGKSGHVLKTELDQLLGVERGDGPVRRLSIQVRESFRNVALRIDQAASRADLTLSARYTLYDDTGAVLIRGAADSVASYAVPRSAYGEVASQNDARERAAELLAERIRAELALRLAQRRGS